MSVATGDTACTFPGGIIYEEQLNTIAFVHSLWLANAVEGSLKFVDHISMVILLSGALFGPRGG